MLVTLGDKRIKCPWGFSGSRNEIQINVGTFTSNEIPQTVSDNFILYAE